jgi:hypothetical protein
MPEIKEEKVIKSKLVDITIVKPGHEASFVQYYDKARGPIRVTVPNSVLIEGNKAPLDELELGITSPTDIEWEKISVKVITSAALAKAMRDNGIFTKDDLAEKRQTALIVVNRLTGLLMQNIVEQI